MRHKHNGINTFSAGSRQMLHNKEGLCWTLFSAWRALFSCSALTFNLWNKYLQSPHADLHTCAFIKTTLISHSIRIQDTEQHQYTACALENKLTVSTSWFYQYSTYFSLLTTFRIYTVSWYLQYGFALNGLNESFLLFPIAGTYHMQ